MTWDDGVPWAIGGGSAMPAEILRLVSWAALGGQEGVFSNADLRVSALETPGTAFRVLPGACSIGNRALNASKELYIQRLFSQDVVDIEPTAGVGRSDLIVAQVENPYISGEPWQIPEDPANGPYIFTRIIPNVAGNVTSVSQLNLGISAITLARIDIPPSTGTIIQSMIHDYRTVVNPMTGAVQPPIDGDGGDGDDGDPVVVCPGGDGSDGDDNDGDPLESTQTAYLNWPFTANTDIPVPSWANYADVSITVIAAQVRIGSSGHDNGFLGGLLRLIFGGIAQEEQDWSCNSSGRQDIHWNKKNMPIPANLRGTTVHWHLQHKMRSALNAGRLLSTKSTKIKFDVKFKQCPDSGS
jgi:hypothetical protein